MTISKSKESTKCLTKKKKWVFLYNIGVFLTFFTLLFTSTILLYVPKFSSEVKQIQFFNDNNISILGIVAISLSLLCSIYLVVIGIFFSDIKCGHYKSYHSFKRVVVISLVFNLVFLVSGLFCPIHLINGYYQTWFIAPNKNNTAYTYTAPAYGYVFLIFAIWGYIIPDYIYAWVMFRKDLKVIKK